MSIEAPTFEEKRQADRRQIHGRRFDDLPIPEEARDKEADAEIENKTGPKFVLSQFIEKYNKYLSQDELGQLTQLIDLLPKRQRAIDLQDEIRQKREDESIEQGILEEIMRDAEIIEDEIELPEAA
jgi:hypothetical protein